MKMRCAIAFLLRALGWDVCHTEYLAWVSQSLPSPDFMCFFEEEHINSLPLGWVFGIFSVNDGHHKIAFPCRRDLEGCSSCAKSQADMEALLGLKPIEVGTGNETVTFKCT